MRLDIYAEELTKETEIVTKEVDGRKFYAVRLFLKSRADGGFQWACTWITCRPVIAG